MGQKIYLKNGLYLIVLVVIARTGMTTTVPPTKRQTSEDRWANYLGNSGGLEGEGGPVTSNPVEPTIDPTQTHIYLGEGEDGSYKAGCSDGAEADFEQFVYNPHIVIHPPKFSAALVDKACCNCSRFREIVSSEMARLEETYRRLREDTKRQLQQLQTTVSDLAGILKKLPETKATTTQSALISTPQEPTSTSSPTTTPSPSASTPPEPTTAATTKPTTTSPPTSAQTEPTSTTSSSTTSTTTIPTTSASTPSATSTTEPTTAATTTSLPTSAQTEPTTTITPTTSSIPSEPITTTLPSGPITIHKDCSEALARGARNSGVYMVQPVGNGEDIKVYCDMETDGGGWTVFQRRQDGTVDFYRDFESYRRGFGSPDGEFWLGNDNLHRLTAQDEYELRVDLTDFEDNYVYATYDSFRIGDTSNNYRLTVGAYSGTAGDSLSAHNNKPFSTKDRDNDENLIGNCARQYHGAWWYERCHQSNLNGMYLAGATEMYARGVVWRFWKGYRYSLKSSEMKFRKK